MNIRYYRKLFIPVHIYNKRNEMCAEDGASRPLIDDLSLFLLYWVMSISKLMIY